MLKRNADKRFYKLRNRLIEISREKNKTSIEKNKLADAYFKDNGFLVLPSYYQITLSEMKKALIWL